MLANQIVGSVFLYMGRPRQAYEHFDAVLSLYDEAAHRDLLQRYSFDPGTTSLVSLGWLLTLLGYPDQGLQKSRQSIDLAQRLALTSAHAFALFYSAMLHQMRREVVRCRDLMEQNAALAREQSGIFYLAAQPALCWAQAEQGEIEEAIAGIRSCMAEFQAAGNVVGSSYYLLLLADFYGKAGQLASALGAINEAFAFIERHEERWHEAETHRIKGTLLLKHESRNEAEAERSFLKAIDTARNKEAKWFELRASVSLGRLWQKQGRRDEARALVAGVYNWFTEGFDTVDLREARGFLEELL